MLKKGADKQPTVFILYIPGGAMLGLNPAMTLSRLEALTETPTSESFQVIEGVSTGSILASGFNMPGMTANKIAELYVQHGPRIFPDMAARWAKMISRNGLNTIKKIYDLDPKQSDLFAIETIRRLCEKMKASSDRASSDLIDDFKAESMQRWLTAKKHERILELGEKICQQDPGLEKYRNAVLDEVAARKHVNSLRVIFNAPLISAMDGIKNKWAKMDECLFPSATPEKIFRKLYGERKLSDSICSTYISAYDIPNNRIVTFSCLKEDLFDRTPGGPATVKNDLKFWDATMASSANELAFKSHITETNLLCTDKAPLHRIRSVNDVLSVVPPGTKIVVVIAGTGKNELREQNNFLEETLSNDDNLSPEMNYRKKLEFLRDNRAEYGLTGNLASGQELAELEGYTTSDAIELCKDKIGEGNVFDFTPRMSPRTKEERAAFPSRDVLNASEDNIRKILNRARDYCEEEDERLRHLAQMIVDNLHLLGKMDHEKYARVCRRIGLKTFDIEQEIEKDTAGIEKRIASNDNSTGLRRIWRSLKRQIFETTGTGGPRPPAGPPPRSPF